MSVDSAYAAYLDAVRGDLEVAARRQAGTLRRRRAQRRFAAVALAAVALLAGSALAGAGILGGRATHKAQATLNSVWDGSDDSALAPTGEDARGVAFFHGDTLYESPGRAAGSVCLTVVAASLTLTPSTRSGSCFAQAFEGAWPFGVNTRKADAGQAVFGRIRAPGAASLSLEWPGSHDVRVPLGLDGYFLVKVPLRSGAAGVGPALGTLRILDGDGRTIATREFIGLTR
jgi:hypothetical protein